MTPGTPAAAAPLATRDLLAALAVVLLWGVNFVVMKWGLRFFTPFQLGAMRYLFAALPLVFFLRPPAVRWRWVVLYGLFQGVGQFGMVFLALRVGLTAALASVLMQTQVFFTALWAFMLLHERPGRPLLAGLSLAAVGLVCFGMHFTTPGAMAGDVTLPGVALALCGAASWAASNIVARMAQKESPGYEPLAFVVWSSLVPVLPFMALSAATDADAGRWLHAEAWTALPGVAWASVAYLGWFATILGYGLWTGLLTRYPANRVAPFSLGVPVVGLSAGMLVLGESVSPWQWAGVAGVVAALACVVLGPRWAMKKA
ncbi:EamA family transporter [Paracidovorax konjaci]|uniref:O-acetylserine/cysteine efflux transporter n=1 Tax=Paracidovorax konjaci TaxID=32040 RepID=A0A1I1W7A6_9BURK|nr:EamA family transporter [Paracidovorax konjaci]SFD91096.1 O-acetylserine/cysteine efflux transporter [Paracidovorax konjaci]